MIALASRFRFALAVALIACLAGCGGGGGGGGSTSGTSGPASPISPIVTANGIAMFTLTSHQTGQTYPITVWEPPNAATGTAPAVIYVLDADYRFATLQPVLQQSGVRATLVGVGDLGTDRRQVDFLQPGDDPYYLFLTQELAAVIEAHFRVDPAHRVLSGHSSGGLFCMYAFFKQTPANRPYSAYICADGSYWQQPDLVLAAEAAMYTANQGHDLPITLVMGADQFGNLAYMDPLYQVVLARKYPGLNISEHTYALGHLPMDAPFFNDALAIIFPAKN